MDLDAATLWTVTQSDLMLRRAREMGVATELFTKGAARQAWKFVVTYQAEHGELPGPGVILDATGCVVKPPAEEDGPVALSYLAEQLHERHEWRSLSYGLGKGLEELENGNQDDSRAEVLKLADHLRSGKKSQLQISTLASVGPEVLEQYERIQRGEIGVPFPWPTMTAMTMGMWPQTLTFFVARPGVGKTWVAVICALYAWAQGLKVLVVSPEISRVELGERLIAKHGQFAYGDMIQATLGVFAEKKLYQLVGDLKTERGDQFFILDDEEHIGPEAIEQAIAACEPELVVVDSLYMMKVAKGKISKGPGSRGGRYDRILETVDWLRSCSRRTKLPFIAISQLSKDGKVKKSAAAAVKSGRGTGGMEDALAFSDTLFMDAHNLIALYQDHDMRLDKQLMFVPLKVRRAANISGVVIRWDMVEMNFDEIGTQVEEKEYEDKEFDEAVF